MDLPVLFIKSAPYLIEAFSSTMKVCLTVQPELIPKFLFLLQKGVTVRGNIGCSIRSFLCDQLGISPDYVEKRIQTCFLNGKAVDDIDKAILESGARLSLSSALPGLLGATLRKGGYYASLRSSISFMEGRIAGQVHEGNVILKLYNLISKELGPDILRKGVTVPARDVGVFFKEQPKDFWNRCRSVTVDGQEVSLNQLASTSWKDDSLFFQLST